MNLFPKPSGVDTQTWGQLTALVEHAVLEWDGTLTTNDIVAHLQVSLPRASQLLGLLVEASQSHPDPDQRWDRVPAIMQQVQPARGP